MPTDADLLSALRAWQPARPEQRALRDDTVAFVEAAGGASTDRAHAPEHVTASCFVVTPDLSRVLLCHHRKGGFWVQLGGHVEPGDASVAAAALREAREEGGIDELVPWSTTGDGVAAVVDVDRHALSGAFGRCRVHRDVGHVAFAAADAVPVTSDESDDVRWFRVDALPQEVPPGFAARLAGALAEVRRVLDGRQPGAGGAGPQA